MAPVSAPSWNALVALCRARLRRPLLARAGWLLGFVVTALTVAFAAALGRDAVHGDVVVRGVRWLLWLGLLPVGLVAAAHPAERDRADGVELLVALHGASAARLGWARWLAAMLEAMLRIAAPALVMCLATLALGARWAAVAWQAGGLLLFAALAGALLGTVAFACGHWGGERGRLLLLLVLLAPWAVADAMARNPVLSLPGLLEAGLDKLAHVEAEVAAR